MKKFIPTFFISLLLLYVFFELTIGSRIDTFTDIFTDQKTRLEHKEKIKVLLAEKVVPTQRKIADELGIALGKVNKFIKEIKKN